MKKCTCVFEVTFIQPGVRDVFNGTSVNSKLTQDCLDFFQNAKPRQKRVVQAGILTLVRRLST